MYKKIKFTFVFGLIVSLLAGCGYTTRGFLDSRYKTVYVRPAVNDIEITGETQENDKFRSVPPLLENYLTSSLLDRFNLDGILKVVVEDEADLVVETVLKDYYRESIRYDEDDDIEEQRIKLVYEFSLFEANGSLVKTKKIVASEKYATTGANARTEEAALDDLMDDAARRLVENIVEAW